MRSLLDILKEVLEKLKALTTSTNKKTEIKLLWTNPNPTKAFAAQTVSVNGLSSYDEYEVVYKFYSTLAMLNTHKSKVGYGTLLYIHDSGNTYRRNVTASGNNLTISDVAGSRDDNAYVIPYQIYGIKLGGVVNHFFRRWFGC